MEAPTDSIVFIQYGPALPEFLELTKEKATGIIYSYISAPLPGEQYESILKMYQAKYSKLTPDPYVFTLYEMVYVYADALAKVGDPANHAEIGAAIGKTEKNTVMGRLAFDPENHCAREGDEFVPTVFYQIWEGERYIIYPKEKAQADFRLPPWIKKAE
jgi:branched-chain amino acid transport system substrate-binding protein